MSLSRKVTIGTRGSILALKQTDIVAAAIQAIDPTIFVEVRIIKTKGDVNQNPIPVDTVGKGWFTEEIENALRDTEIDLAVHSLKDMAEDMSADLCIGAYLAREDVRDVLLTKHGETLDALPAGAIIGTDSLRRQIQMLALRPDVVMQSLRGNLQTRINKLEHEPYSAIILAAAGLKRLGLDDHIVRYFEPHEITPAPGQGILAVQARKNDTELLKILESVNDADTAHIAEIERSFSRTVGGGCKKAVGVYAYRVGDECHCLGMITSKDGKDIIRDELVMSWDTSDTVGEKLAHALLARAS